jgi:hypothetical protein
MSVASILTRSPKTEVATQFLPIAYGSFSSTQTQLVNPAFPITAVLPLVYDTTDITPFGVSCATPSANIVVATTGVYKVLSSVQCDKTSVGVGDLEMWIAVGGVAVPNSATRLAINQNIESLMAVEWFLELTAGDAVSINLASAVGGLQALAVASAPPVPAIPSVITTITRIA